MQSSSPEEAIPMEYGLDTVLTARLQLMFDWYRGMINERTGRLHYMYYPQIDLFSEDESPLREIASIWEMEILSGFLARSDLKPFIDSSLRYFGGFCSRKDGHMILDPKKLREPSSIAHSAFMILALLHSAFPEKREKVALLSEGILKQQRPDGSYKIYFDAEPDSGLELYPGEAMLSHMEAYRLIRDPRYLESVERGWRYYRSRYYERGRLGEDLLVFYANWQSQFCRLLFQNAGKDELREGIRNYLFHLQDRIVQGGFCRRIETRPEEQSSVEVACAAEGLNDAYAIAGEGERIEPYGKCLCTMLGYLLDAQCVDHCTEKERGGFGFSQTNRTQRVDVTGHVVSAFIKSVDNKIVC